MTHTPHCRLTYLIPFNESNPSRHDSVVRPHCKSRATPPRQARRAAALAGLLGDMHPPYSCDTAHVYGGRIPPSIAATRP